MSSKIKDKKPLTKIVDAPEKSGETVSETESVPKEKDTSVVLVPYKRRAVKNPLFLFGVPLDGGEHVLIKQGRHSDVKPFLKRAIKEHDGYGEVYLLQSGVRLNRTKYRKGGSEELRKKQQERAAEAKATKDPAPKKEGAPKELELEGGVNE